MGLFGWSLPPGCGTLPGEEEFTCDVCGFFIDDCVCHECKVCGTVGDPNCYEFTEHGHWQELTDLQKNCKKLHDKYWESENSRVALAEKIMDARQILYTELGEEALEELKKLFKVNY